MTARAGAEEEMRMGTEATKWTAERALDPYLYAAGMAPIALSAVLEALGIPLTVLAWITANPEAAKGLASGGALRADALCDLAYADGAKAGLNHALDADGGTAWFASITDGTIRPAIRALKRPSAPSGKAEGDGP